MSSPKLVKRLCAYEREHTDVRQTRARPERFDFGIVVAPFRGPCADFIGPLSLTEALRLSAKIGAPIGWRSGQ